jgi:hypothetical protein
VRQVRRRAQLHGDRNGDPLEGLVNLFDLGIVLAVAFLLAALTATRTGSTSSPQRPVPGVSPSPGPSGSPRPLPTTTVRATGPGTLVGGVYQLPGGGLVYVPDSASPTADPTSDLSSDPTTDPATDPTTDPTKKP